MTRQEAIENLTLALLYLTRIGDGTGQPFNEIAWKNYDFDAINALDSKDLAVDPRTRRATREVRLPHREWMEKGAGVNILYGN